MALARRRLSRAHKKALGLELTCVVFFTMASELVGELLVAAAMGTLEAVRHLIEERHTANDDAMANLSLQ